MFRFGLYIVELHRCPLVIYPLFGSFMTRHLIGIHLGVIVRDQVVFGRQVALDAPTNL